MSRAVLLFLFLIPAWAADPAKAGMDAAQLARVTPRLQAFVAEGRIAGAVGLVSRRGQLAYLEAVGHQNLEERKPMRPDTIFQIMSMTKPVTAVGVVMLAEEGLLTLTDPVERHLPEFRGQWMIEESDGKSLRLRRPSRPITIRDLLTHTSGMTGPDESAGGLYQKMHLSLAHAVTLFARAPLAFEPGSRWSYSNTGIATLGRLIEVCSGKAYEQFLAERIFQPLGMNDSFFFPPEEKTARIAMVYQYVDGRLVRSGGGILGGDPAAYRKNARFPAPEFGLYSTAADLAAFYQMMLNGGVHQGRRLLSRSSVELMTRVHTDSLEPAGHSAGMGYGLAWTVVRDRAGTLNYRSPGTFGHGGAFGTHGWVDPLKKLVGVFLIQRSSGLPGVESDTFMSMVGAAVTDEGK